MAGHDEQNVAPAFNGGGQIEPIQILYPAPEAQVVGDAVMVAGRISTYPMIPLPDFVIVNGVQVPVHDNHYFITTLPAQFTGGQMDIYATTDSGLESAMITVYPD